MKVKVLETCGMEWALLGLSLSYNKLDPDKDIMKLYDLSKKLAKKDGGHNKFLESIITWIDITASRKWWSQFDTYRVGVTKQSESTMHTLLRDEITQDHFKSRVKTEYIEWLNHLREDGAKEYAFQQLSAVSRNSSKIAQNKQLKSLGSIQITNEIIEWE